ncbi:hypothetical protein AGMMS50256_09880 [Betaproteobacteria bacterium]|nr:hypothetical protein AGMMS50256_09880 [Betaproteobacteria bacterium]
MTIKWTDVSEIAIGLSEAHPDADPGKVNFVDLMRWIAVLPDFADDPRHCNEKILEAVQQAWMDEAE